MEIWIHLLISMLTFFSFVVLTFSLFKIPLLEHHRIIISMSCVLGMVHFYTRFVIESKVFGLIGLAFFIILLMVIKRYPIFYCLIVCGIGFLIVTAIDTVVTVGSIYVIFSDENLLETSLSHFVMLNLVATLIALIITFLLRHYNVGFSFVIRKFSGNQVLKGYNFFWASIVILSVTVVQINYFVINVHSLHFYLFLAIALALFFTLAVAYRQNKKSLKDRFGG